MGYPKWKYSPECFTPEALDGNGVIVQDPDEEARLGPGWYDSPADFAEIANKAAPKPQDEPEPVPAPEPLPVPGRRAQPQAKGGSAHKRR